LQELRNLGSNDPQEIYLRVKHGILTPDFLERNIFWYTGQLILSRITKLVSRNRQILRLKCTKFDFGWGSAPDPAAEAYSAPPDLIIVFKGASPKCDPRDFGPRQKLIPACLHCWSLILHGENLLTYFLHQTDSTSV